MQNLEYLKLKQMVAHLDETIDFMTNNQLSFVETLIKLTDHEINMKEINIDGGFPLLKGNKRF